MVLIKRKELSKKENSIGSSPFVTILLTVVIIGLVGVLGYVLNMAGYITLPKIDIGKASRFEQALNENNYQAAYTVFSNTGDKTGELEALEAHLDGYFTLCFSDKYESSTWTTYRGVEVFNEHISPKVLSKLDEIVSRFYSGEFSEQDAKTYVSRVGKFSFAKEKVTLCSEEIGKRDTSKKAYEEGVTLYNSGNFEDAVKAFRKVSALDTARYNLAHQALEECKKGWGQSQLDKAQVLIDAKNYSGARVFLEDLIELFGEYEKAQEMLILLAPVGQE